jgi:DNA-binding MarR family transcriptional regulator
LNRKIIYGLERLSDAFKTLLWEKAKVYGISPIQIQILLFVANHKSELCNVSHLAKEFNVTKPTISDAVRVLNNKGYLDKDYSTTDSRRYALFLTDIGNTLIGNIADYSIPFETVLKDTDEHKLNALYTAITELIFKLNRKGILEVQRICFGCRFYENKNGDHYCNLLQNKLKSSEIRLDCSEYEDKATSNQ